MKNLIKKSTTVKLLCFFMCLLIIGSFFTIVKGQYPPEWDYYTKTGSFNKTIYNYSKADMDKYGGSSSYTLVPTQKDLDDHKAHGDNNEYTNLTIDTVKKKKSKWFLSGYGPFLHYAQFNSSEATSIKFSEENNLFRNSNYVYVANGSADLGDAKSFGILHYEKGSSNVPPLLINNNSSSFSSSVLSTIKKHNKKNIVLLGGSQRYTTMFGIGEQFNVVRIGGADRNQTYLYLGFADEASSTIYNVSSPPALNSDGYIMDIKTEQIKLTDKLDIEDYLKNFNFDDAAKLVLEKYQYGSPAQTRYGDYEVLIGCKESESSNKMKFLKVYFLRNSAGFQYGVYQYVGSEYKYDNNPNPDPIPEPTPGVPPTAEVYAPSEVVVGDDAYISGKGNTLDEVATSLQGTIIVNGSDVHNAPIIGGLSEFEATSKNKSTYFGGSVWFGEEGIYTAQAIVEDNNNQQGPSQISKGKVVAPIPKVNIRKSGAFKENRKVVIDASGSSSGSQRFNIVWEKAKWEVSTVSGSPNDIRIQKHTEGSTNGEVLVDSSKSINKSLDGLKAFDMTFKKPGTYKIKCTLTNDYKEGKTNSSEIIIVIEPDTPPIVNFSMPTFITRDPNNNAANGFAQATIKITDTGNGDSGSYSTDGDLISDRAWMICFDANNNGTYKDDKWFLYDASKNKWEYFGDINAAENYNFTKSNGNKPIVEFSSTHVGKYRVELIVREQFGEEYIPQFITDSDRRTRSTFN